MEGLMDNKTQELRDIFLDVADEETVTESQEAERGSLTGDDRPVDGRLRGVLEVMREKFTFAAELSDEEYCELVRLFYDGADDGEIAAALSRSPEEVFAARLDLHLIRDDDPLGDAVGASELDAIHAMLATEFLRDGRSRVLGREHGVDRVQLGRPHSVPQRVVVADQVEVQPRRE